ncbi:MAG: TonB-dependent receptor [Methylococcaceae bacterium]|nr:MAG: TonB-dependent receptor [Methylococcaceae bacterium]
MYKKTALLLAAVGVLTTPAQAEEAALTELESVVVTAPALEELPETGVPLTILSGDELRLKTGHSIGETLKQELGISSQSFGPGVGTPVIRGQSGPRVRVLGNGIGSNDASALSPDHATSVEPLLAERIEVLRGPATLLYGGGAIGGVVNVIDNRIPAYLPEKALGGALEQRFDSSSDETSTTLKLEGGQGSIAYHLDGFYRDRGNLAIGGTGIDTRAVAVTDPALTVTDNPHGFLNNSGADAISGSAGASWIGAPGFAGVSINHLENNYGIAPDGSGEETTRIAMRQDKYDFKSELNEPFRFAKTLRTRLGYTDYQHTEITNGEPGAFYTNQSYEGRLELVHQDIGPLRGTVGLQAQASDFDAIEKLSGASIVPHSQIHSYGLFAVESFDVGAINYQLGTRVEQTDIQEALVIPLRGGFAPQTMAGLSYTPVSASASALWKLDDSHSFNLGLTRSARAPQVQELLSDGYHDATRSYERGNIGLREETSYNLDLGYRFKADWMRAEFDLFHNWAGDYIYQQRSGRFVDEDGNPCVADCVPLLVSGQQDAIFKGYEAKLIFPVMENSHGVLDLTLFSDYTRGQFKDGSDVPRLPPLRYGVQLDHSHGKLISYLRLTRADSQPYAGDFETPTDGYLLLNIGTQYQVKNFQGADVMLFAKGNNLLNENIRNATSYLRNFAPEPGRGAEIGIRIDY